MQTCNSQSSFQLLRFGNGNLLQYKERTAAGCKVQPHVPPHVTTHNITQPAAPYLCPQGVAFCEQLQPLHLHSQRAWIHCKQGRRCSQDEAALQAQNETAVASRSSAQCFALHCEYPANTDNESNMLVAF
jgi:hypothetical protein